LGLAQVQLTVVLVSAGCGSQPTSTPSAPIRPAWLIAHVGYGDIDLTVSLDPDDNKRLVFKVPAKVGTPPRPVRAKLDWRDETAVERIAERLASASNAGVLDWRYGFDAKRTIQLAAVYSITVRIGDQMFVVYPW
jgi:hypothetical protein